MVWTEDDSGINRDEFLDSAQAAEAGVRGVEGEICESVLYVLMIGTPRGDCNLGRMRLRMTNPVSMRLMGTRPAVVVVLPLEFSVVRVPSRVARLTWGVWAQVYSKLPE
jgi:hypothetical protein